MTTLCRTRVAVLVQLCSAALVFCLVKPARAIEFTDVTASVGLVEPLKGMMGDGDMDLVLGIHFRYASTVRVVLNRGNDAIGDPIFDDVTDSSGVAFSAARIPHVEIQDFDNDGRMDILMSVQNGLVYRNAGISGEIPQFEGPEGSVSTGGLGYWPAAPAVDFDRDGRLDIMGAQWESSAPSPLLRNTTPNADDFIDVKLALSTLPNQNGIGATVSIYEAGHAGDPAALLGVQIISVADGYSSGSEAMVHFGVTERTAVDVVARLPNDGPTCVALNVATGQVFTLKNCGASMVAPDPSGSGAPSFDAGNAAGGTAPMDEIGGTAGVHDAADDATSDGQTSENAAQTRDASGCHCVIGSSVLSSRETAGALCAGVYLLWVRVARSVRHGPSDCRHVRKVSASRISFEVDLFSSHVLASMSLERPTRAH